MRLAVFNTLLFAFVATAPGADSPVYPVAGQLVDSSTTQPIRKVRLELRAQKQSIAADALASTVTGDDGRFAFPPVKAGNYHLVAFRRGLPPYTFGAKHLIGSIGSAIIAGPGEDTEHLIFRMETPAVLDGYVRNDSGEPIRDALVTIWRSGVYGGRRYVSQFQYIYTDDRGYYRAAPIPGGTYYISASGTPWYSRSTASAPSESYLATFFANTADPDAATPIRVDPGGEVSSNLVLNAAHGGTLRVNVKEAGGPLVLDIAQPGMRGATRSIRVESMPTESSVFSGLAPGRYMLRAYDSRLPGRGFAHTLADVLPGGNSTAEMTFTTGAALSGKVQVDPELGDASKLMVVLTGIDRIAGRVILQVRPDGTFQGGGAFPGAYAVGVSGMGRVQIGELTAEGTKVETGRKIEITDSGAIRLSIRLDRAEGSIAGKIRDGSGKPVTGALVLAGKRTAKKNEVDAFRAFYTETDGSFDFQSMEAGTYVMMAFRDADELEYQEPAVYKELLHAAVEVVLGDGAKVKQDLTVP